MAAPGEASGSWAKTTISAHDLNDVSFPVEQTGWAVGGNGTILKTANGGASWAAQPAGTAQVLNGVDFVDASTGWVVGAGSTIRSTTNGGQTWTARAPGIDAILLDVDFVDATHGWAVGSTALLANLVLATKDGGVTWTPQAAPAGIGLISVSFADRLRGFAVGYLDAAYRTEDGGATWIPMAVKAETFEGFTTDSFYATRRTSATEGMLAGFRGEIYRTEDAGLTWAPAGSLGKPVRGLAVAGAAAFASGDAGAVARSTDGGKTWQQEASTTTANLKGIAAPSAGAAFTVGVGGALVSYRDAVSPQLPLELGLLPELCDDLDVAWRHAPGGSVVAAVAADVDGDGSTEVVSAGAQGIRALRPFAPTDRATIWYRPFQTAIRLMRLAELDGDPLPELVISTAGLDPVRSGILALDAEDGAVRWSRRLPTGTVTFQVADLDRDGRDDIAAVTDARELRLLAGADGSNLRPPLPLGATPGDVELADLNADGLPEQVVTLLDGRALALDGATGALRWSYETDGELRAAASGDLTGDGTPDVVLGGTGVPGSVTPGRADDQTNIGSVKGAIVVALDGRDGTRLWDYGQNNPFMHFGALALGDLTGDGVRDVVGFASRYAGSHLLALDGRGHHANGVRTGEPLVLWRHRTSANGESSQSAYTPEGVALADGNGDGTLDAFTAQWSGDIFAVSGRLADATSSDATRPPEAARLWLSSRDWQLTQATPVQVDGRLLVLATSADGLVALREAGTGEMVWAFDGGVYPAVEAANLDADPGPEVALGTAGGRVHGLDPDGSPLAEADAFLSDRIVDVAAADADLDGQGEIVAASVDGTLALVDPRTSEILWTTQLGAVPNAVAAGDGVAVAALADGRLVGLHAANGEVSWSLPGTSPVNDVVHVPGAGVFAAGNDAGSLRFVDAAGGVAAEAFSSSWIGSLALGDLDGNGQEEVVAGTGASVAAYGTDGGLRWQGGVPQSAASVAAGDMDGDGRDDVVALSLGFANAFRGDGSELWETTIGWPGGAAVVDVDGDGSGEALVGSHSLFSDGRIRAFRADGSLAADCRARALPKAMAMADLGGDGSPDAVVSMRDGGAYLLSGR